MRRRGMTMYEIDVEPNDGDDEQEPERLTFDGPGFGPGWDDDD